MHHSPQRSAKVLNSWKQIADYLGRGVRTVQRWEDELGMPVHRPRGKQRSAVVAIPDELDKWLERTPTNSLADAISNHVELARNLRDQSRHADSAKETARLGAQAQTLLRQAAAAHERLRHMVEQLTTSARLTRQLAQANSVAAARRRERENPRT